MRKEALLSVGKTKRQQGGTRGDEANADSSDNAIPTGGRYTQQMRTQGRRIVQPCGDGLVGTEGRTPNLAQ
jgi:hypothetical protein